jgi:predicted GIY-YIG superfamily endonuclease
MKKHHVYELINLYGSVEYVGETIRPTKRMYQHIKVEPREDATGMGLFYGRQDLVMNIVKTFDTRKEALNLERKLKEDYGFPYIGEKERGVSVGLSNSLPCLAYNSKDGSYVGEYYSIHEASRELKADPAAIHRVIHGKSRHAKGYTFKYKEI